LNEEIGYVNHPSRFQVYPWAVEAVALLNRAGFAVVVLTNQSGVARGYFDEALVAELHARLQEEIARGGGRLDGIYYCPHHPEGKVPAYRRECACRKPQTGMLDRAVDELHLRREGSYVAGDRFGDVELAHRAGLPCIFLLSGYGLGEWEYQRQTWPHQPWKVAKDLLEAAKEIVRSAG
jgi:D-glycero-D-manno-heptose 1,7-bisphosphate phosphatase